MARDRKVSIQLRARERPEGKGGGQAQGRNLPSAMSMPGLVDATSPTVLATVSAWLGVEWLPPGHVGGE